MKFCENSKITEYIYNKKYPLMKRILINERQLFRLVEQTKDLIGQFIGQLANLSDLTPQRSGFKYNEKVEMLQIALSFLGFGLPKYGIDGKFGPETLRALNKFQKQYKLPVTAIASKESFDKLSELINDASNKENLKSLITGAVDVKPKNLSIGKTDISQYVVKFLISKGLTPEQASGVAGNLYAESGFNTKAIGDGGSSYGIAQWHNERKSSLMNWAKSKNLNVSSINTQLNYLWLELNNSHVSALSRLKRTSTPSEAATVFAKYYEKPLSSDYSRRSGAAEDIYRSMSGQLDYKFY
jgi:peptidoglycan hydrolase-like protein with peptidoglycan-binding domain